MRHSSLNRRNPRSGYCRAVLHPRSNGERWGRLSRSWVSVDAVNVVSDPRFPPGFHAIRLPIAKTRESFIACIERNNDDSISECREGFFVTCQGTITDDTKTRELHTGTISNLVTSALLGFIFDLDDVGRLFAHEFVKPGLLQNFGSETFKSELDHQRVVSSIGGDGHLIAPCGVYRLRFPRCFQWRFGLAKRPLTQE